MLHPLKISGTMADETRYLIYEFMLQQKRAFSVQEIADQFSIHPNVARLHLTKLSEIDVISAEYVKTGKGGRPGRAYKTTEDGVTLSFPKRDEPLMLNWLLQLVEELGEEARTKASSISFSEGKKMMEVLLLKEGRGRTITLKEKVDLLSKSATLIGYVTNVVPEETHNKITFSIFNCPFRKQLATHNEIACQLHESYLIGQVEALFQTTEFVQTESMVHNCEFCNYEIKTPK